MSNTSSAVSRLKVVQGALGFASGKVKVNGAKIAYVKVGTGKHAVLLLPGALGSAFTDFGPQLKTMDRGKFTIVSWDPRGYGRSIPPKRDYPIDFFYRDADDAVQLMAKLGFFKYSLLGWSDGGNIACVIAAKHPDKIEKLVVWGSSAYVTKDELDDLEKVKDISSWSAGMKQPMIDIYGEEYLQKTWLEWNAAYVKIFQERDGDIYIKELDRIEAPTLIIHGTKDYMTPSFHAKFLKENIKNSVVEYWDEAKHNLHLRYPEKFNARVEKFLHG